VARYSIKKSDISVEGFFAEPAFNLLHANSEVLSVVVSCLSDYCPIRGTDIRIEQDSSTVGNTNVVFKLHPLNGIARISVDKAQIVLFSPHTQEVDFISRLSSSYFDAISEVLSTGLYGHHLVEISFHAALENTSPADHTSQFISVPTGDSNHAIGHSVTHYFGKQSPRLHSSITLDMSWEFSDCVFVRAAMGFDANEISTTGLKEQVVSHSKSLLALVGLEAI